MLSFAAPAYDDITQADPIYGSFGTAFRSNIAATMDPTGPGEPVYIPGTAHSVWLRWTTPADWSSGGNIGWSTKEYYTTFDTIVEVFHFATTVSTLTRVTGSAATTVAEQSCPGEMYGAVRSCLTLPRSSFAASTPYLIRVSGGEGLFYLRWFLSAGSSVAHQVPSSTCMGLRRCLRVCFSICRRLWLPSVFWRGDLFPVDSESHS